MDHIKNDKAIMDALTSFHVEYRYSILIYNIWKNSKITVKLHEDSTLIKLGKEGRQHIQYHSLRILLAFSRFGLFIRMVCLTSPKAS